MTGVASIVLFSDRLDETVSFPPTLASDDRGARRRRPRPRRARWAASTWPCSPQKVREGARTGMQAEHLRRLLGRLVAGDPAAPAGSGLFWGEGSLAHQKMEWGCRAVVTDPDGRAVELNQQGHCAARSAWTGPRRARRVPTPAEGRPRRKARPRLKESAISTATSDIGRAEDLVVRYADALATMTGEEIPGRLEPPTVRSDSRSAARDRAPRHRGGLGQGVFGHAGAHQHPPPHLPEPDVCPGTDRQRGLLGWLTTLYLIWAGIDEEAVVRVRSRRVHRAGPRRLHDDDRPHVRASAARPHRCRDQGRGGDRLPVPPHAGLDERCPQRTAACPRTRSCRTTMRSSPTQSGW